MDNHFYLFNYHNNIKILNKVGNKMVSEAKKRANKKWNDKNRARMTYIRRRSDSKNFILKFATEEDLEKTLEYVNQRKKYLKNSWQYTYGSVL